MSTQTAAATWPQHRRAGHVADRLAAVDAPAPPRWPWRQGAIILPGAARLLTVSAMVSADPFPATWSALRLAIAPAPLAAVTAFAPAPTARPANGLSGLRAAAPLKDLTEIEHQMTVDLNRAVGNGVSKL